jgi:hypothetical protein
MSGIQWQWLPGNYEMKKTPRGRGYLKTKASLTTSRNVPAETWRLNGVRDIFLGGWEATGG